MPVSLELAQRYVEHLIARDSRGAAGFKISKAGGDEVIPGVQYRFRLREAVGSRIVSMSVFLGVGGLGGALWGQEMRTLERLGSFAHPAFPELIDGGHLPGLDGDAGAAYVRTLAKGDPAGEGSDVAMLAKTDAGALLAHLWSLADALGLLHESHISHRGLWPGALLYQMTEEDSPDVEARVARIQLARFEMSALLANLFRSHDDGATYEDLRRTYLMENERSRLYTPPERLRFVFSRENGELGGPPGDVFSLGMIAAEWLTVDRPEEPAEKDYDSVLAYQRRVRSHLETQRGRLPGQLVELLQGMLDPVPGGRPTAYNVVQDLAVGYAAAREWLKGEPPGSPYLVAFMPTETDKTLLAWGVVQHSASTDEGHVELAELIERDMQGAEVLESAEGAVGFATGTHAKLSKAKTVVVGPQITWFCERFWCPRPGGAPAMVFDNMLVVKFVRETRHISTSLDKLRHATLTATVPMVDAVAAPINDLEGALEDSEGRPSWTELVKRQEGSRTHAPDERQYLSSLEWYVHYQQAMLEARTFGFVVEEQTTDRARLRWDEVADRQRPWIKNQVLSQTAVLDLDRLPMATFLGRAEDDLDLVRVDVTPGADRDWRRAPTYDVLDIEEPDVVVVATRGRPRLPQHGWLRLRGDAGTDVQLGRQREAVRELGGNRMLLSQLISPKVNRRPSARWDVADSRLQGEGASAVREMLEHEGLFALQGPPGTGKTEVTSEAVKAFVEQEAIARVLVSAQSHDALDNLAERITRKLGITVPHRSGQTPRLDRIALRIESGSAGRDDSDPLARLTPSRVAADVVAYSTERSRQWLASRSAELPAMVPVIQRWLRRAPGTDVELTRRVRGAANILFATTGASTRRNLFVDDVTEPFHWVVVEEASRAWPTELALPLVRGLRWTLVGDHAQIGAYSNADVVRFLDGLASYEANSDEIRDMYVARQQHAANFRTFARFFEESGTKRPVLVLTEQYRMDAEISTLVGDTFYRESGGLTARRPRADEPLDEPYAFRNRRIVWIDTGTTGRCQGVYYNEYEADLVTEVVRSMRPDPGRPGHASLAVLTPYRAQVDLLQGRLVEHRDRVFTVDGYQGREADIVVASLVRDRVKPGSTMLNAVGHVSDPGRTNVLLSRARELLVVVGRLDVYSMSAGPHWRAVTEKAIGLDAVLRADDWRNG